jgi:hypothetical protein
MKVEFDDGTILYIDEDASSWIFSAHNYRSAGGSDRKYSATKHARVILKRQGPKWHRDVRDREYVETTKTIQLTN